VLLLPLPITLPCLYPIFKYGPPCSIHTLVYCLLLLLLQQQLLLLLLVRCLTSLLRAFFLSLSAMRWL
jgi:hypothetical protein